MQWTESMCFFYEVRLNTSILQLTLLTLLTLQLFVETAPQLFHNASIWLTLVLAVQRYIYICQASRARHLCTIPRARKMVAGVLVAAFLHMSPRLFDRVYTIQEGEF